MIIDSSALIAAVTSTDAHHDMARAILGSAQGDLWMHPINLAEVLVGPTRAGRVPEFLALLSSLGIHEVASAPGDAAALAQLRVQTGLRMPDCCVLRAAEVTGVSVVMTFDRQVARAARAEGLQVIPEEA